MRSHTLAVLAGTALLSTTPAWAAHPQEREGFWIGFGFGYGSADLSCNDCEGGREGSVTGFLKLGGTLNKRVLLGVETNVWTNEVDGVSITFANVSGTVTVYPQASSGFFLKAGAGVGRVDTTLDNFNVGKNGFGFVAGIGYDVRVGRRVSITPCANFFYGLPGNITVLGESLSTNLKYNVVDFGIGVTFH